MKYRRIRTLTTCHSIGLWEQSNFESVAGVHKFVFTQMAGMIGAEGSADGSYSGANQEYKMAIVDRIPSLAGAGREQGTASSPQLEEIRENTGFCNRKAEIDAFIVVPKRCLFHRTPTLDILLRWTKQGIRWPMTSIDKSMIRCALKCFRDLQRVMRDRKYRTSRTTNGMSQRTMDFEIIQKHLSIGLQESSMRNELYLHVLKQITVNPHYTSLLRGWEVMCAYSTTFPPSKDLIPIYLDSISLGNNVEMSSEERARIAAEADRSTEDFGVVKKRITMMAKFVRSRLARLAQTGPQGPLPTLDDIANIVITPFKHQVFGVKLEEIMEYSENRDETGHYPRILTFLSESILELKGNCMEGIFRVPGFVDEIQQLRLRIEMGNYSIEGIRDPNIPASLLKSWFRELSQPVVPFEYYEHCLLIGKNVDEAMKILDEIPEINRKVLKYLIKFLQVIGDPKFQLKTKMSVGNLAMVFAPNILRCPSENPLTILANSRLEQNFLKTLINYLQD